MTRVLGKSRWKVTCHLWQLSTRLSCFERSQFLCPVSKANARYSLHKWIKHSLSVQHLPGHQVPGKTPIVRLPLPPTCLWHSRLLINLLRTLPVKCQVGVLSNTRHMVPVITNQLCHCHMKAAMDGNTQTAIFVFQCGFVYKHSRQRWSGPHAQFPNSWWRSTNKKTTLSISFRKKLGQVLPTLSFALVWEMLACIAKCQRTVWVSEVPLQAYLPVYKINFFNLTAQIHLGGGWKYVVL